MKEKSLCREMQVLLHRLSTLSMLTLSLLIPNMVVGATDFEVRTIDGAGNNLEHPEFGASGVALLRVSPVAYADGISEPAGANRQSAREISNTMCTQLNAVLNSADVSDFVWQWGQFIDHDLDLTTDSSGEFFPIPVPIGDEYFDPNDTGDQIIPLVRSIFIGGTSENDPRQQINEISTFIDASNVYGSDAARAAELRTFQDGKLKTSKGGKYLPYNTNGLPNAGGTDPNLYLAGDVRANEQVALTAMHTLFVREHNWLCDRIRSNNADLCDEDIYQRARKIVGAEMQVITYNEFLSLLLGPNAIGPYNGYNPQINPGISNEFSVAAYRFGHSMVSSTLLFAKKGNGQEKEVPLKEAFFNPKLISFSGGLPSILLGLASRKSEETDTKIVDALRNFLFGEPGEGGFDLASLNIQRGRDHGLADYNSVRQAYNLEKIDSFAQVTSNPELQEELSTAYSSVDDMDLWAAGLAEDHMPGALVGETFYTIITDQFKRLRDGDRFWYENDPFFTPQLLNIIRQTKLSKIIRRNTKLKNELQDNVFLVPNSNL